MGAGLLVTTKIGRIDVSGKVSAGANVKGSLNEGAMKVEGGSSGIVTGYCQRCPQSVSMPITERSPLQMINQAVASTWKGVGIFISNRSRGPYMRGQSAELKIRVELQVSVDTFAPGWTLLKSGQ